MGCETEVQGGWRLGASALQYRMVSQTGIKLSWTIYFFSLENPCLELSCAGLGLIPVWETSPMCWNIPALPEGDGRSTITLRMQFLAPEPRAGCLHANASPLCFQCSYTNCVLYTTELSAVSVP